MRRMLVRLAAATVVVVGAAASGAAIQSGALVRVAHNAKLGQSILVDSRGLTLYVLVGDSRTGQGCLSSCQKTWPILATTGRPRPGAGVKASLLGAVKRPDDGKMQVTYEGHPLYRFAGYPPTPRDRRPGDVHGQGFASYWFVLTPTGRVVKKTL